MGRIDMVVERVMASATESASNRSVKEQFNVSIPLSLHYRLYKVVNDIHYRRSVRKKGLVSAIVELALEEYLDALEKELQAEAGGSEQ